jgi:hypothetical protein
MPGVDRCVNSQAELGAAAAGNVPGGAPALSAHRFAEKGKGRWERRQVEAPEFEDACDSWKELAMSKGVSALVAEADRKRFWDWLRDVVTET